MLPSPFWTLFSLCLSCSSGSVCRTSWGSIPRPRPFWEFAWPCPRGPMPMWLWPMTSSTFTNLWMRFGIHALLLAVGDPGSWLCSVLLSFVLCSFSLSFLFLVLTAWQSHWFHVWTGGLRGARSWRARRKTPFIFCHWSKGSQGAETYGWIFSMGNYLIIHFLSSSPLRLFWAQKIEMSTCCLLVPFAGGARRSCLRPLL